MATAFVKMSWNTCPPVSISIPKETRNRLADLLGDLLSAYWKNCKEINDSQQREDEYDK